MITYVIFQMAISLDWNELETPFKVPQTHKRLLYMGAMFILRKPQVELRCLTSLQSCAKLILKNVEEPLPYHVLLISLQVRRLAAESMLPQNYVSGKE